MKVSWIFWVTNVAPIGTTPLVRPLAKAATSLSSSRLGVNEVEPERSGRAARTTSRLLPMLFTDSVTLALVPAPSPSMAITAATPIITPSTVRMD